MLRVPKLLFLFLFAHQIPAQILENHFFGNTVGADILSEHLIALDDGGAVITGRTNALDTGGYHVLLIRTDSLGKLLWQRTYHQGGGAWVAKALDGGFIVGGSSDRHIFGSKQGFVLKVNESGVEEWHQYLPDGDHSYVSGVEQLSSGNIAVCGIVVDESANISQKVFWAIFSASGGLVKYQTVDNLESGFAPKMVEAKNGNLMLAWSSYGPDRLRCFTPTGQTVWESDLTSDFDYELGYSSLLADTLGGVWVAGGYKWNLNKSIPQVLHFSSTGILKKTINLNSYASGPTALFSGKNGEVVYWISARYASSALKFKWNYQGILLSKDSIFIDQAQRYNSIAQVNENRVLLLTATPYSQSDTWVQPIQKSGTVYEPLVLWKFSSGLPYSHDYYESHCKSWGGGEFILTRGEAKTGQFYDLGYYILRTDEADQEIARTYLGDGSAGLGGQIQATQDGGAIALGSAGQVWKVDAHANLVWNKMAQRGQLLSGPSNDFFIVEPRYQPNPFDPILIYHYDQNGDSIAVNKVYSRSQPYDLLGGVSQMDNGPVLFGHKFSNSDSLWHNWIIYLDKSGEFVSETLLNEEYALFSYQTKMTRSADGGIVIASYQYTNQGIYMMHLKDGEVLWEYNIFGSDPDSLSTDLISIEEVPCKGYLVAFESNSRYTYTQSTKLMILHHIDENGQGKDFYAYNPLLGLVHPDTSFLPGYTFRRWGHQLNGQTFDILLQTVQFPDTNKVVLPSAKLVIKPNPSGDEICLHYETASYGLLEIEFFNAAGQRVDRFKSEKTSAEWAFHYQAHYPAGTYFIQIKNGEKERVVQRWVKVR